MPEAAEVFGRGVGGFLTVAVIVGVIVWLLEAVGRWWR